MQPIEAHKQDGAEQPQRLVDSHKYPQDADQESEPEPPMVHGRRKCGSVCRRVHDCKNDEHVDEVQQRRSHRQERFELIMLCSEIFHKIRKSWHYLFTR